MAAVIPRYCLDHDVRHSRSRPVRPRDGERGGVRRGPRPRGGRLRRPSPDLRRAGRAEPPSGLLPARQGDRLPHRTRRAGSPRVGSGPRGAVPLQRQRVPGGRPRLCQGPGRVVQRELPLRRRGAPLPVRQRFGPRRDLPRQLRSRRRRAARVDGARGARSNRGAAPGRRRLRRGAPGRSRGLRDRARGVGPGRSGAHPVARRPVHRLHRRDDRDAQGRAVALRRHLHERHGRQGGRHLGGDDLLRPDRRSGPQQRRVPAAGAAAAHARGCAVGGVHDVELGRHDHPAGVADARRGRGLASGRGRGGPVDRPGRRRHGAPAAGRARRRRLRHVVVVRARQRRGGVQRHAQGRVPRGAARPADQRLAGVLGDRRPGLHPVGQGRRAGC